jgi:citrate synthase
MSIKTGIWLEEPVQENEFAPKRSFLFGHDYYSHLAEKISFVALTYLHLTGKLPTDHQEKWLGFLLNLSANPGIRDESSLAAMNTAIGAPPSVNSVLAGLMARSGLNRGARWIEKVMENIIDSKGLTSSLVERSPYSGLGKHFGHTDERALSALSFLKSHSCWGQCCQLLEASANPENEILLEGIIAAGFLDIGLSPACGAVLFLLSAGPAFAAYALEQQNLGYKAFPNYFAPGHYFHSESLNE